MKQRIGFGGGCHWCTEAVFQQIQGVEEVAQGYIASTGAHQDLSEAVVVTFTPSVVSLKRLIEIHLHTHEATSAHSFRKKYRSAIYYFSEVQQKEAEEILHHFQKEFKYQLVTLVLPFKRFKGSRESIVNYYIRQPEAPFCKKYIEPKLKKIQEKNW